MLVPQLSTIMDIQKEELPNFFVMHSLTETVVPFPDPLDDPKKFDPKLMLLWARRTVLYLEVEKIEEDIKELEAKDLLEGKKAYPTIM